MCRAHQTELHGLLGGPHPAGGGSRHSSRVSQMMKQVCRRDIARSGSHTSWESRTNPRVLAAQPAVRSGSQASCAESPGWSVLPELEAGLVQAHVSRCSVRTSRGKGCAVCCRDRPSDGTAEERTPLVPPSAARLPAAGSCPPRGSLAVLVVTTLTRQWNVDGSGGSGPHITTPRP